MSSHIDYSISPEAIYPGEVLVSTHEPAIARPMSLAESPKVESIKGASAIQGKLALGSAIDCLRDDLISLYVSAEQIHWHLRLELRDRESHHAFCDQAEDARQLSGYILRAIARSVRIKEKLTGEGDSEAPLKAVLALQAENDALALSAAS